MILIMTAAHFFMALKISTTIAITITIIAIVTIIPSILILLPDFPM